MTAALRRAFPPGRVPLGAVLWGAVAPDIPLFALVAGGFVWFHLIQRWPISQALDWMLRTLYIRSSWWLGARSVLHAPLVLAALGMVAWLARGRRWSRWLAWFAAACAVHTFVDVLTHVADGPLLLFPFEWSVRLRGPVSYWDPRYHGHAFAWFELGLDVVLIGWLSAGPLTRWRSRRLGGVST